MKYVYNEERDRLACGSWHPHFFITTFEDELTKEQRFLRLHTCTNVERHVKSIAEKYANADEKIKEIKSISRKEYEKWLCNEDAITIQGKNIPASFITDFLITEDKPDSASGISKCGDLSTQRARLLEKDENLMQEILESYEKAMPENDIIRE